jgi:SNF2 family DNA or RNA helicase
LSQQLFQDLLEKAAETTGRILLFGGFQGSVDRLEETARNAGWEVFRCDGRGSLILDVEGKQVTGVEPLRYWKDRANKKVAFIANPESGGFGLTLVEANIVVFYSNSFKPEFRVQAEERADRPGQVEQVVIYDLLHLPSDKRTLDIIRDNRRLENMVLGDVLAGCFL